MAYNVLVDTGFWIGLYDPADAHHQTANEIAQYLELADGIVIPHPTLYEFVNTRLLRNKIGFSRVYQLIRGPKTLLVDDGEIRRSAWDLVGCKDNMGRSISLVDMEIRLLLENSDYKIDAFITFNRKDFEDICGQRKIEIIDK